MNTQTTIATPEPEASATPSVMDFLEEESVEEMRRLIVSLDCERRLGPMDSLRYQWLFGDGAQSTTERPPESATQTALRRLLLGRKPPELLAQERQEFLAAQEASWRGRARKAQASPVSAQAPLAAQVQS